MIWALVVWLLAGLLWAIFAIRMQLRVYGSCKLIRCFGFNFLFWPLAMVFATIRFNLEEENK